MNLPIDDLATMQSNLARALSIIESTDEIIIVTDLDRRVREWNRGAEKALGYSRHDILGSPSKTYVAEGDWALLRRLREKVLAGETVPNVPATLVRSDGSEIRVVMTGIPVRDHLGSVVAVATLSRDVTGEYLVRQEMERSNARFQALHRHSSDLALIFDARGTVTYVSPAITALFDRTPEEVMNLGGLGFTHTEDAGIMRQAFIQALGHPGDHVEVQGRSADRAGRMHWLDVVFTNLLDEPAVEGVVANVRDITQRKEAEIALASSEARLRATFRYAAVGQVVADVEGTLVDANDAFCSMLGFTLDELGSFGLFTLTHPDDRARNKILIADLLADRIPSFRIDKRYVRKDGSWAYVVNSVSLIPGQDGGAPLIMAIVADVTEAEEAKFEIQRLALHDGLTGLPNRSLVHDRLEQSLVRARRRGGLVAILFIDVDHFKAINDDHGRSVGDEVLRAVGKRIVDTVTADGTVARVGGDEFMVLVPQIAGQEEARVLGQRIVDACDAPTMVGEREIYVTASVGVAVGYGNTNPDQLVAEADAAMLAAKDAGRCRVEVHDRSRAKPMGGKGSGFRALRSALDHNHFKVVYQPIVALADRSVVGAEALLRWDDPERGRIGPGQFIGLAEDTGLIGRLGAFVLDEACCQLARWREAQPELGMAVNISARQLDDPGFVDEVGLVLARHHLPRGALTLELTESVAMADLERTARSLEQLRQVGCLLSIDDFGTGYSSVRNLRSLPFDVLKIDREFVSGLPGDHNDLAIVRAMVAMSAAIGLVVVAEGVETVEQDQTLKDLGCRMAQGYLFSRPVEPDAWNGVVGGL
ncbi:MAG: sensor domain-containing protein [Acidimicrobiales bacterium]